MTTLSSSIDVGWRFRLPKEQQTLPKEELAKVIAHELKPHMIRENLCVDFFLKDQDVAIRLLAMKQLSDKQLPLFLIKDPERKIRQELVRRGVWLEELVSDPSPIIREMVAEQGIGLEVLLNDEDTNVETASIQRLIAEEKENFPPHASTIPPERRRKYLERFVRAEDWKIREIVALQGYGLEVLMQDEHIKVKQAAKEAGANMPQRFFY